MPCRCDGFDDEPPQLTELEAVKLRLDSVEKLLCGILTTIFFEKEDEKVKKICEESKRCLYWFRDHLKKDIKTCDENIKKSFSGVSIEIWEQKRLLHIKQFEKINNMWISEFKNEGSAK